LGSRYRENRRLLEPLFRLVLDVAALATLLRRRGSGSGRQVGSTAERS
jgi:hypothetical protein